MTYCCGILVREGLVMVADTRTNAGLDNISTFRKLHVFERPGERALVVASAGNLSVTQGVLHYLADGLESPETGVNETIYDCANLMQAAHFIGRAVRRARTEAFDPAVQLAGVNFDVSLLLGGQIGAAPPRLFMIYSAGNCIECTTDTNYLQIGEHKYGKPILDRAVNYDTGIHEALKIALISMDSTIRSNLSVGPPIDIILLRRDALRLDVSTRIDANDPYFRDLRERWSKALRDAHMAIPAPPYGDRAP